MKKPLPGVRQRDRRVAVRRVVVELQRALVTAIAVVVEHPPVAPPHVTRLQDHEVGREAHQTAVVRRRLVEIDHVPLGCRLRIDGKMRAAGQPLIGAHITERVVVGKRRAFGDPQLDPVRHAPPLRLLCHFGLGAGGRQGRSVLHFDPGPRAHGFRYPS